MHRNLVVLHVGFFPFDKLYANIWDVFDSHEVIPIRNVAVHLLPPSRIEEGGFLFMSFPVAYYRNLYIALPRATFCSLFTRIQKNFRKLEAFLPNLGSTLEIDERGAAAWVLMNVVWRSCIRSVANMKSPAKLLPRLSR